jgi:hypothetical protein
MRDLNGFEFLGMELVRCLYVPIGASRA